MRLYRFLFLLFLITQVDANPRAKAWERVWIWYAYQIDLLNPPSLRMIATGCKGGAPGGTCWFTQLMEHIDGMNKGDYDGFENDYLDDPENLRPDPRRPAQVMIDRGWSVEQMDNGRIISGARGYIDMIGYVASCTAATRKRLTASQLSDSAELFDRVDECLGNAISFRRLDMSRYFRNNVNNEIPGVSVRTEADSFLNMQVDYQATLDWMPNWIRYPDIEERMNRMITDLALRNINPQAEAHRIPVAAMTVARDVSAGRTCGGPLPAPPP